MDGNDPLIHRIRLRGPWTCVPLAWTRLLPNGTSQTVERPLPPPGVISMPADWSTVAGADFRGRVRFVRRFGRPSGLDANTSVFLAVDAVDPAGIVHLNGQPLGHITSQNQPWRCEITQRLLAANELEIVIELPEIAPQAPPLARPGRLPEAPGGLIGEVRLEIFAT